MVIKVKREFELPGIQDLTKEQENALALPFDGQHLIIGGPGTGKSVLALMRARQLEVDKKEYIFLIFNHLLKNSSAKMFGVSLRSKQWQSWFIELFKTVTSLSNVPTLPIEPGKGSFRKFDWVSVLAELGKIDPKEASSLPYLIIDEGQDMPPEFYEALTAMGFENFFVAADQNQQITDGQNSSRQDIQNALALARKDIIELRSNHRNNIAVARLARTFYTNDPASPPPELPQAPQHQLKKPLLYGYSPDVFLRVIVNTFMVKAINNPKKLLGILCPNNLVRDKYYNALSQENARREDGGIYIRTFRHGDQHDVGFEFGGIIVINAQACKGLEFDSVMFADIDQFKLENQDIDQMKRLFYVMASRAKDEVTMFRQLGSPCPIEIILPNDTDVLEVR